MACLPGRGTAPPFLMCGHVDVVTTENQTWRYPPFAGEVAEGFIWGRGALDMKSGVAMMLAALLRAKAEGFVPPGDILLVVLSDEEGGGDLGARFLVEEHPHLFQGHQRVRRVHPDRGRRTFLPHPGRRKANLLAEGHLRPDAKTSGKRFLSSATGEATRQNRRTPIGMRLSIFTGLRQHALSG